MGFFSNLFGGGNKSSGPGYEFIQKPPYTGARPYTGAEVGMGAEVLKPLSEQYMKQIMERSRGEGQVGFQPEWYETRKKMGLSDLKEQYDDGRDIRSAQASGQGLRGGIPLSIERQAQEDYGDTTGDFLDKLSIADLEARREDINKATYAQPQAVQLGSGIQESRANFDLNEYNATLPAIYQYADGGENPLGDILSLAGQFMGGQNDGGQQSLAQAMAMLQGANKSTTPQKTLADYRAEARRY